MDIGTGSRHYLDWGYVEFEKNEQVIASTVEDPSGIRLSSKQGGSLGKVSFSRLRPDFKHNEYCIIVGSEGVLSISINPPGESSDGNMKKIVEFRNDVVEFEVPIDAPNLEGGAQFAQLLNHIANLEARIAALEAGGGQQTHVIGLRPSGGFVSLEIQGNAQGEVKLIAYDTRNAATTGSVPIGQVTIDPL